MEPGKIIKTFKSKKGSNILIRYPKSDDLDAMLTFANDIIAEDTFVSILSGKKITKETEQKYLEEVLADMQKVEKIQLVAEVDGAFVGNCEIRRGVGRARHVGSIGISISQKFRDQGLGRMLLTTLIAEAEKMHLRLLELTCMCINDRALHLYESLGFQKAGIIPGALEYKGKDEDQVIMYLPL